MRYPPPQPGCQPVWQAPSSEAASAATSLAISCATVTREWPRTPGPVAHWLAGWWGGGAVVGCGLSSPVNASSRLHGPRRNPTHPVAPTDRYSQAAPPHHGHHHRAIPLAEVLPAGPPSTLQHHLRAVPAGWAPTPIHTPIALPTTHRLPAVGVVVPFLVVGFLAPSMPPPGGTDLGATPLSSHHTNGLLLVICPTAP